MNEVTGFGRGKLILCGEHAVVHGQPAIAFASDLGTTVHVSPCDGPTHVIGVDGDPRIDEAARMALGEQGHEVRLSSTLPLGRGMGSSAAFAVALVRAGATLRGETLSEQEQYERALPIETLFHSRPSGLDVAISVRGGIVRFTKGNPPVLEPLPCPSWQVVVLDTGKKGDTGKLVDHVTSQRPGIDPILARIGALTDEVAAQLDDVEALGALLDENQRLLAQVGVSSPEIEELCELALAHGAHGAKLTGAGGGGVVMALVTDPAPVLAAAKAAGVPAWTAKPQEQS